MTGSCKCGKPTRTGGRYCNTCHAAYMREWRKTHRLTPEQALKDSTRSYTSVYIRRGNVTKGKCAVCKHPDTEAHHKDYSQPLLIVWLCKKHHHEVTIGTRLDNFTPTNYKRGRKNVSRETLAA